MRSIRWISALLVILLLCPIIAGCGDRGGRTDDPNETDSAVSEETTEVEETTEGEETMGEPTEDKVLDILFLGNSLMYYNDMPDLFGRIATMAGKQVSVSSVTKGSATMSDFASPTTEVGTKARAKLSEKKWDYVVIEPSRRITPYETTVLEAEIASAKTLQALAAEAGAKILLYSVWGNNTGSLTVYHANTPTDIAKGSTQPITRQAHSKFMHETNERIAQELGGVQIVPAGYAFENLIDANTIINLYDPDERHPSAAGSYLAACSFYAFLFGERTVGLTYTFGLSGATADALQTAADRTVIEKMVPDLSDGATSGETYNLLLLGSNLLDDYNMAGVLGQIVSEVDGKTLNACQISNSTFVANMLVHENDESNDLGAQMREKLAQTQWDAIVIQISRRCTASSDVAASELAALQSIWHLLSAETDRIYLYSLNGEANPSIFTTAGGVINYTNTGNKESATAEESTAYMTGLAKSWAATLGCKVICYGDTYASITESNTATKKKCIGYVQACCLYNALFEKEIPHACSVTNSLSTAQAEAMRSLANTYCPVP